MEMKILNNEGEYDDSQLNKIVRYKSRNYAGSGSDKDIMNPTSSDSMGSLLKNDFNKNPMI